MGNKHCSTVMIIMLVIMIFSLSFSILVRVFSFFALPHLLKIVFYLYTSSLLFLIYFRYLRHSLLDKLIIGKKSIFAFLMTLVLVPGLFIIVDYTPAPIRTSHTLQISNNSDSAEILIDEFMLPGDNPLNLQEAFPVQNVQNDQLILAPGDSVTYVREMVGGIQFDAEALGAPASLMVAWDGSEKSYELEKQNDVIDIIVDGSSWGSPSLPYRILGILSVISDWVSVFGVVFILILLLFPRKEKPAPQPGYSKTVVILDSLSRSIILNALLLVVAGIYAFFFEGKYLFVLIIFAIGFLYFLRDLAGHHRQWIYAISMTIILAGILANGYIWINPTHDLHQVITYRPENTFAYLADRIGARNATYLSIGYYRYLREARLVITEPLYEELQLDTGRLNQLNKLREVSFHEYPHELSTSQVSEIMQIGEWEVWPNRTGGDYYLLPEISAFGDTFYFFSHDLQYFLIPESFIQNSGVIDVSFSD